MKIAFYMEDGLEQIVLTAEGKFEESMLAKLSDGSRTLTIKQGGFYACQSGWTRQSPVADQWSTSSREVSSTIVVLNRKEQQS